MAPGQHDVVEPAVRFVDAILRRIERILVVGVAFESVRIYIFVRELASDDERILESM